MEEQYLYKVSAVHASDLEDEDVWECCLCSNYDEDIIPKGGFITTVEIARTFNQIRDAATEEELYTPLKKITKYAISFAGTEEAQTAFLKDIHQMKGMQTLLNAMTSKIDDAAAVLMSVKAIRSLIGSRDDILDDWEQKRSELSDTRASLIGQFLKGNGIETFTRAFGLHALKYDPYDDGTQMTLYRTDLRFKIMDVLYIAIPRTSTETAAKLVRFWCRVIPKMLPPNDTANEQVMEQAFLCVLKTLEHKGIQKQLTKSDILEIVSVSVLAEKSCSPKSTRVTAAIRSVWSWAGAFSPM
ncbi:hypothetical protein IV203_034118 [Nitzschia inconspicua]|uniref:Uncharacterized protein n=1 Tax=Nitzschia inconspicua TaxID=303405 RepID=A0A9K3Q9K2_9STRA|nr:hypothetical protein IV203_034118 [Nitzschia inconspicua]